MTTTTQSKPLAIEPASDNSDNRRWFMLIVLLLGQFMALMDVTIVNVAMNTVRVDLHASGAELQLVSAGYFVSYAMLLITGARLGDLYGRRRMFGIGVVVFTASSLVCGLAPNIAVLIIARFVQGAGAAAMMPQIMSVIQLRFTGAARARALSAYSAVISVGAVAGMVLGGILVNADIAGTGWRAVFLVNVPIGVVVTALVPRLVPADRPTGRRRLDLLGLAIALPAVFAIVFPLVLGHELGWPAWTFGCVIAGAVLAVVFVLVERTVADPLLRLDVLRARGMPSGLATLALGMLAYGGFLFSFGLYLQSGMGQTALHAGLIFAPGAAAFGLCGYHWRRLPERVHHLLTVGGYLLCVPAYLVIAVALAHGGGWLLWVGVVGFGMTMGTAFGPLLTHALLHVPTTEAADASGLLTTTMQLAQVTGVATFGSLFLSLAGKGFPSTSISTTLSWLALVVGVGAVTAIGLTRGVLAARRTEMS